MAEGWEKSLTAGAQQLVLLALQKQAASKLDVLGVNHWLLALLERHAAMVEGLTTDLDLVELKDRTQQVLDQGQAGNPLSADEVAAQASERARKRGRVLAAERDLAIIILSAANFGVSENDSMAKFLKTGPLQSTRLTAATPLLDQFGRDLTRAAREGQLSPLVGRSDEIQLMVETLCRRTKRNPVLIGPAGVGKTALVEGLADRIVQGKVPEPLANVRIVALQPSLLVAGASISGELEKRMQGILQEAVHTGVILFIDEIHTLIGAGGMMGTSDLASMLKPALARGDLACIAATTDDEYRRYIESDTALERRFQPIRVQELTPEQTLEVLKTLSVDFAKKYKLPISDEVLAWLVQFGQQFMRNRHFPDKAVDLLEQCYAYAVTQGKKSIVLQDAVIVAQRMIGMPLALEDRLKALQTRLAEINLLAEENNHQLLNRLQVTMRGLDIRSNRPNAVVLLCAEAAESGEQLASLIADALFGASDRVVEIDLSRMWQPEDINLLLGSPPGYVGYSERLPLHQLVQTPWCVTLFKNIDLCHPRIREVIAQAMEDGRILDGRGKAIYFSDAVVLLTAENIRFSLQRNLGFAAMTEKPEGDDVFPTLAGALGEHLVDQMDVFLLSLPHRQEIDAEWLKTHWLSDLGNRFRKEGLDLNWDAGLLQWMMEQQVYNLSEHEWERWVDHYLSPAIIPFLPGPGYKQPVPVLVRIEGDEIRVTASEQKENGEDGISDRSSKAVL